MSAPTGRKANTDARYWSLLRSACLHTSLADLAERDLPAQHYVRAVSEEREAELLAAAFPAYANWLASGAQRLCA